jgi:hypothetical protein
MIAALQGVRLIHLDFDLWVDSLRNDGYIGLQYALPELFLITPAGKMGVRFNKGAWEDEAARLDSITKATGGTIPKQLSHRAAMYMAPPLHVFLAKARTTPENGDASRSTPLSQQKK